jgi:nucleoside-diphosphate-sugar epimerase
MKTKILITGILGYIAREACEHLKDCKEYEICGFDNRFLPDKIAWLTNNNIKFYERDIFNAKDLIEQADIIIHTAGETLVPQTKEQSTPEKDALIIRVGTDGTKFVLQSMNKSAKIVFLSTHVIFEGLKEELQNIDESFEPCPVLAYGTSKRDSECDIGTSGKNFNIIRLASIFGYNDCIRYRILPNLFSKMAALNQNLTVFGAGTNVKPIAGVNDLARFIHFLILNPEYNKETFNFVSEHKTVREIAELCQKYNTNVDIKFTKDAIINNGYGLSNKKLLSTGFEFKQTLDGEAKRMINIWRNK